MFTRRRALALAAAAPLAALPAASGATAAPAADARALRIVGGAELTRDGDWLAFTALECRLRRGPGDWSLVVEQLAGGRPRPIGELRLAPGHGSEADVAAL